MAANAITKWLSGTQEFWEGVKLYDQFGDDDTWSELFAAGPNRYSKLKLFEKLTELSKTTAAAIPIKETASNALPDDLKNLYDEACSELNEMKFLQPKLELVASDKERYELAFRIQTLHISQRFKFSVVDTFTKTGKRVEMPVAVTKRRKSAYDEMNCLELAYQLLYLPQYIGKVKKKLKTTTDQEDMIRLNAMLDQYHQDIEIVKNILLNATIQH